MSNSFSFSDFDINDVNKHQADSYAKRWIKEMNIGAQTNQSDLYRHSKANLETLQKDQAAKTWLYLLTK